MINQRKKCLIKRNGQITNSRFQEAKLFCKMESVCHPVMRSRRVVVIKGCLSALDAQLRWFGDVPDVAVAHSGNINNHLRNRSTLGDIGENNQIRHSHGVAILHLVAVEAGNLRRVLLPYTRLGPRNPGHCKQNSQEDDTFHVVGFGE